MNSHSFQPGEYLRWHGVPYAINDVVEDGAICLRNRATGATRQSTELELRTAHSLGALVFDPEPPPGAPAVSAAPRSFARPLSDLSTTIKAALKRRNEYMKRLDACGALVFGRTGPLEPAVKSIAADLNDPKPPSRSTIHRWYQRWNRSKRSHRGLVPRLDRRGGSGQGRFDDEVEASVVEVIDKTYLTEQRVSAAEAHAALISNITEKNRNQLADEQLEVPSLRSFQRRIACLNQFEVMARREGLRAAKRYFRSVTGVMKVSRILERVEMDHTPLNLFVIDAETGLPLGRPDLTVAVDYRSRVCLGYVVTFHGHGADAVLQCLRHAIISKDYVIERYPHVSLPWPAYGLPSVLAVDNGLEFLGDSLQAACHELGIDLQFMPKRRPEWKGVVERFLRTFAHQFIHTLPGTTFHNTKARGDYDPSKCAVVTLQDLDRWIHSWICDQYHNTVHRGLLQRPIDAWQASALEYPPPMVSDIRQLDFALGEVEERTLWHYGVELFNTERYNSPELARLFSQLGRVRVRVRFQRADIGFVFVENPVTKEFFEVRNIDQEYAKGLTLLAHNVIRKSAKKTADGRVDRAALLKSKQLIQQETQALLLSKNLRDRRAGAKRTGAAVRHGGKEGDLLQLFHDEMNAGDQPKAPPPKSPVPAQAPRPLPKRRFNTRDAGTRPNT